MSERFYVNWPLQVGPVLIDGPEAHHLAGVCRVRPGDRVFLFNGDGAEYPAEVREVARREVALEVQDRRTPQRELDFRLEMAVPLPRGDRAQFLIEKLTELGVTTYVPLLTERTVIHPREGKIEKLQRCVIEASKQCGRNHLMEVCEPVSWQRYVEAQEPETRILAHPSETPQRPGDLPRAASVRIAVGPEGGFSPSEVEAGQSKGWLAVSLGARILRVETAAVLLAGVLGLGSPLR